MYLIIYTHVICQIKTLCQHRAVFLQGSVHSNHKNDFPTKQQLVTLHSSVFSETTYCNFILEILHLNHKITTLLTYYEVYEVLPLSLVQLPFFLIWFFFFKNLMLWLFSLNYNYSLMTLFSKYCNFFFVKLQLYSHDFLPNIVHTIWNFSHMLTILSKLQPWYYNFNLEILQLFWVENYFFLLQNVFIVKKLNWIFYPQ